MVKLRLATWNVLTVDDEVRRNSIFEELKEYNIDVACLQETKLLNHKFIGDVHRIFSPVQAEGKCHHGVGFACKNGLVENFDGYDNCDPNRLVVIKLVLNNETIHTINVYAPANTEDHNDLYLCLECAFSTIPESETVFIFGDFNAQVGADNVAWPTCLGPYGVGEINENGQRLLEFCSLYDLCVLNTYTELQESEQYTHQSTARMTWSQPDQCITRLKDRYKAIITLPVGNVRNSFDHKMVIVDIDTQTPLYNTDSDMKNIQADTVFRYLLRSCLHIAIRRKISQPAEDIFESKEKDLLTKMLLSNDKLEVFNESLKELIAYINKFFYNEACFTAEEHIIGRPTIEKIVFILELFFETKLEIKENVFKMLCEEVRGHLIQCYGIISLKTKDNIFKITPSMVDDNDIENIIDEYKKTNKIEQAEVEILKTLIIKCCQEIILPEELLYMFICQQCINIINLPYISDGTGFCSNLGHLLSKCMLTGLKPFFTDDMLQQRHIFKCQDEKNMLFALNLLQEKCLKKVVPFYIAFVDFSQILSSRTTPTYLKCFKEGPQWASYLPLLAGIDSGNGSQTQRELMELTLSYILVKSFEDSETTLTLKYDFKGILLDRLRLNAKSTNKCFLRAIQCGCFAAIFGTTKGEMQKSLENLEITCNSFGVSFVHNTPLIIAQNVEEIPRSFHFGLETIFTSDKAKFHGINFTSGKFSLETEIFLRIHNACKSVQTDHISNELYYNNIILPNLMCHLEVLSLTDRQEKALDKFNERCLKRLQLPSDPDAISKRNRSNRLALLDTYQRQKSASIATCIFYGDLDIDRQCPSYVGKLKKDLKMLKIID